MATGREKVSENPYRGTSPELIDLFREARVDELLYFLGVEVIKGWPCQRGA
jgi:hypothetical protein